MEEETVTAELGSMLSGNTFSLTQSLFQPLCCKTAARLPATYTEQCVVVVVVLFDLLRQDLISAA